MKNIICILLIVGLSGCGNDDGTIVPQEKAPSQQDSIFNYKGNFIKAGNAAVLKGDNFIFQVKMDTVARALKDSVGNYAVKNQSVLPVEVLGKVSNNPEQVGYSQLIEIKEILKILAKRDSLNTNEQN